ncbi:MAG: hypothetical protein KZQ99_08410 [Candidatus Thiodiazotropha sp. (ex Dulcina madagascariensis)]|nr:hypothetical protein [Candidatus Thiodiazotropha sp. (ex Dulcina madagascariensis)]
MGWKIPRLSRRTFLKSAAGGTGLSLLSPIGGVFSKAAGKDPIETETSHSICNYSRLQIYRSWGDRLSLLRATTEKETAYA